MPSSSAALILVACLAMAACQNDPAPGPETDRAEVPLDAEPAASLPGPTTPAVVAVRLTEDRITVPQEVVSGSTALRVYNAGVVEHGLAIEGEGTRAQLPQSLQPGESLTLKEDLEPGTYRLYCPLNDHTSETLEVEVGEAR